MKKSFVITLTLIFIFSLSISAFAANPFSDVPANHWAYGAVSKLAQEGVIDGYGNGRYLGNSNITRYEMAQIVAKAMANMDKASSASRVQIEKLAAEYADELDSLGVRVAKLEKNSDNVKITGEVRISHYAYDKKGSRDKSPFRTRLWVNGQINDSWKYVGMIQDDKNDLSDNGNQGKFELKRAWVEGKVGAIGVKAGRFNYTPVYGITMDADTEGIKLDYKTGDFKFEVFAIRPDFSNDELKGSGNNQVFGAQVGWDNGKWDITGAYYHTNQSIKNSVGNSNIFELAAGYKFTKEFKAWAEYLRGSEEIADGGKDGFVAGLIWSNRNKTKPGTFEARATYYDVPAAADIKTVVDLDFNDPVRMGNAFDGFEGYRIGATYMLAKNIDVNVDYYDLEGQKKINGDNSLLWSYVRFYF